MATKKNKTAAAKDLPLSKGQVAILAALNAKGALTRKRIADPTDRM